jgi:hypothetical protein
MEDVLMKIAFFILGGILVLVAALFPIYLVFFEPRLLPDFRDAAIIYASFFMCVGALIFIVMTGLIALIAFTLRDKVVPTLDKVDDTVKTVRGTATFLSESVVAPVIKTAGAAAGAKAMVQTLMRRKPKPKKVEKIEKTEEEK